MTGMLPNPRVPEGYEHGRIHVLPYGIYACLSPFAMPFFNGRTLHGGTPPLAPEGVEPSPSAVRFVVVLYSPKSLLTGGFSYHDMATLPDGTTLRAPPEITGIQ